MPFGLVFQPIDSIISELVASVHLPVSGFFHAIYKQNSFISRWGTSLRPTYPLNASQTSLTLTFHSGTFVEHDNIQEINEIRKIKYIHNRV